MRVPQRCPSCDADLSDPDIPPGIDKTLFGRVILNRDTWQCPDCWFEWMVTRGR